MNEQGVGAFDRSLGFNEMETCEMNEDYLRKEVKILGVTGVRFFVAGEERVAAPGNPAYELVNV